MCLVSYDSQIERWFRSINRLVFGIETQCVFCGVKPEVLNSGVWISGFIGKWDLLVRITMAPHFEVEILQRAYSIEIFEVHFLGVEHLSPTDVDTDFCSHDIYELSRELPLLLVEPILIWHAENNVPVLVLWSFDSHSLQRMHSTLPISDFQISKDSLFLYAQLGLLE